MEFLNDQTQNIEQKKEDEKCGKKWCEPNYYLIKDYYWVSFGCVR
jgi:hypothetical protein